MVEIIIYVGATLLFFALLYLILGIVIAKYIVRPARRSKETLLNNEQVEQNVPVDVINAAHEKVQIKGHNKYLLNAKIYMASKATNKWIIAMHGYCNSSVTLAKYAVIFNKLGYNVLATDMRRCGGTGGKSITFGYYERRDCEDWIEYLYKEYKDIEIGLYGISLGAATAILVASLRSDIKFVISYCSFSSFKDIVIERSKLMFKGLMLFYPAIVFGGYFWSRAQLNTVNIQDAIKNVDSKILILHSKQDDFTPYSQAIKLSEANPQATLYLFEGGIHARAYATSPKEYESVVTEFLQNTN